MNFSRVCTTNHANKYYIYHEPREFTCLAVMTLYDWDWANQLIKQSEFHLSNG